MPLNSEGLDQDVFYRALFEVNTALKFLLDPESGLFVDANQAACEFYGYPLEVLRTKKVQDINAGGEELVKSEISACLEGKKSFFEFRHRVASGEIRDVEIYSGPIEVGGRRLLLSIVHDVTHRKRLEEQLRQAQKMEAVGQLAGGIAHDFNNMLTALFGYTEMIESDAVPGSSIQENARHILRVLTRAEDLTRQLLAFSRKKMLRPRPVSLSEVVRSMQDMLARVIGEHVRLETELAPELPSILADPGQLELVVMNLAVNARDAMPGGGLLTIRTWNDSPAEALLSVQDTGHGMDESTKKRLFEPFFTTKAPNRGTGLGLSTVYSIVQQCGGGIDVESQPGHGARFTIRFPTTRLPAESLDSGRPPRSPQCARDVTILVVEDEEDVREILCRQLESAGYRVLQAGSGEQALRVAAAHPRDAFSLLLTDVRMPGISGPELARRLRAERPGLRLLMISGYSDGLLSAQDLPAERAAFLQKPFTGSALLRKVSEALRAPE